MVSHEMAEKSRTRLENLIACELALEQQGKTIWHIPACDRASIHPNYAQNSSFWWDATLLQHTDLIPALDSRRKRTFKQILDKVEILIKSGEDVFSLNRFRLAEKLKLRHTSLRYYIPELTQALEEKYGKRLWALQSARDGHVKLAIKKAYEKIMMDSRQLRPAANELADILNCSRAKIAHACKNYGIELSRTVKKPATIKRWREILTLENKLARQNMHLFGLPDDELKKYFPNYGTTLLRKDFRNIYNYMQLRLSYLAENGKVLTTEAKEIQKLIGAFSLPR